MSSTDFQDRIQRISANPTRQGTTHTQPAPPRRGASNLVRMAIGGAIMWLGVSGIRFANENYEAIRDSNGVGTAMGVGLVALALALIGLLMLLHGIFKAVAGPAHVAPETARRPSAGARLFFSLLGFALGSIACLYLFVGAAARLVDTERAISVSGGSVMLALLLAGVSLFFGLLALFIRGVALGRVPVYFAFGAVLTWAAFRIFRINPLEIEAIASQFY